MWIVKKIKEKKMKIQSIECYKGSNVYKISDKDLNILKTRIKEYDRIKDARVGDFFITSEDHYVRFTHAWDDHIQTSESEKSGSFYLGNGYISYSGGLDPGFKYSEIVDTGQIKKGWIWFFHDGWQLAHCGVHFNIDFRVFKIISS